MAVIDINAKYVANAGADNDSKKDMVYTSDTGELFVVKISEAIGESMGFADYETSTVAKEIPKGLTMRTVSFADATGKVKGSYPVGTPTTPVFVEGGTITVGRKGKADGVTCAVTGAIGEKRRILAANDTGQQNGDAS